MSGPDEPQEPPSLYEEVTATGYAEAFANACTAVPNRRGVVLMGTCPRCGHAMEYPLVTQVFQNTTLPGSHALPAPGEEHPLLCTCLEAHPERPPSEEGCGAYWNIQLTRSSS